MVLVRQVAPPMLHRALRGGSCLSMMPCFALWSCFPMEPCGFPAGSYSPMVPRFALWSCFPMVLCGRIRVAMLLVRQVALPKVPCFALGAASRWCFAPSLAAAASRWCRSSFPGAASSSTLQTHRLPRSGNLFRTDFRFAPSLPQRFACGLLPFTRDMGVHGLCGRVPDSAGSIICHPAASPGQAAASSGPGAPDC